MDTPPNESTCPVIPFDTIKLIIDILALDRAQLSLSAINSLARSCRYMHVHVRGETTRLARAFVAHDYNNNDASTNIPRLPNGVRHGMVEISMFDDYVGFVELHARYELGALLDWRVTHTGHRRRIPIPTWTYRGRHLSAVTVVHDHQGETHTFIACYESTTCLLFPQSGTRRGAGHTDEATTLPVGWLIDGVYNYSVLEKWFDDWMRSVGVDPVPLVCPNNKRCDLDADWRPIVKKYIPELLYLVDEDEVSE